VIKIAVLSLLVRNNITYFKHSLLLQSEIALSWWSKKKEKITRLKGQLSRLTDRISTLEAEAKVSADYISQLETELEKMAERNKNVEKVLGSVMEYGGFDKIDDSSNRVLATGALILSYLAVIMKKTQAITRLRVVIEALFSKTIFGVDATKIALNEMYTK
jgi:septal ring factor EnvC (AmiA/AmiB activator)